MTEPTPTTAPTRRKRRQAMSDEGRQILQRERQRVAREQAVLGERLAAEARRNEKQQRSIEYRAKNPEDAAVQRGIVKRIAAVLASEDINVRLDVAPSNAMKAWTDFERIYVRYRPHADIRLLSAVLRGLMYHEGGHVRWTLLPFPQLRKAVQDAAPDFDWPLDSQGVTDWRRLHRAWNGLEDQRMETAVTSDSPVKAAYLTPMIMTELTDTPDKAVANWPLLIWRRYLPRKIRAAARAGFVAQNDEFLARQFEVVVDRYVKATDPVVMMEAVVAYAGLLDRLHTPIDLDDESHGRHPSYKPRRYDENGEEVTETPDLDIPISPEMDAEEEEEDDAPFPISPPPIPQDMEDEGEDEGEGDFPIPGEPEEGEGDIPTPTPEGEEADEPTNPGKGAGGEAGEPSKPEPGPTQEELDGAIKDAEAERDSDTALDDDVEAFHQAMEDRVSELNPYTGGISNDVEASNEAEILADEIERSFQAATMDRQPAWVEHQKRGIINAGRYEVAMQQPTPAMDFYRDWVEDDQPGFNMAVSLMLDYSSSMHAYTKELAQTAYAVKLACQKLDIPCTVTLWDTDATVLYDAKEQADGLPLVSYAGGTDPSFALADLDNQRFDKVNHIVLIMTDGEWYGEWDTTRNRRQGRQPTLAWHANERSIIGFGFDKNERVAERYRKNLEGYGCTESFGITDLLEIPDRLRDILISQV